MGQCHPPTTSSPPQSSTDSSTTATSIGGIAGIKELTEWGDGSEDLAVDPDAVTVITSALASGAVAGVKDTAVKAIKDAYAGLKRLITDRYAQVDVSEVEKKPDSKPKRDSLAEDLADAGAGEDVELLDAARRVLAVVRENSPQAAAAVGVDLERIEAAAVRIREVIATGGGVRGRDWAVSGDIDISGVRGGDLPAAPNP